MNTNTNTKKPLRSALPLLVTATLVLSSIGALAQGGDENKDETLYDLRQRISSGQVISLFEEGSELQSVDSQSDRRSYQVYNARRTTRLYEYTFPEEENNDAETNGPRLKIFRSRAKTYNLMQANTNSSVDRLTDEATIIQYIKDKDAEWSAESTPSRKARDEEVKKLLNAPPMVIDPRLPTVSVSVGASWSPDVVALEKWLNNIVRYDKTMVRVLECDAKLRSVEGTGSEGDPKIAIIEYESKLKVIEAELLPEAPDADELEDMSEEERKSVEEEAAKALKDAEDTRRKAFEAAPNSRFKGTIRFDLGQGQILSDDSSGVFNWSAMQGEMSRSTTRIEFKLSTDYFQAAGDIVTDALAALLNPPPSSDDDDAESASGEGKEKE